MTTTDQSNTPKADDIKFSHALAVMQTAEFREWAASNPVKAATVEKTNFCKDCKFIDLRHQSNPCCSEPSVARFDLVSGNLRSPCQTARANFGLCGSGASLFVAKVADLVAESVK